MTDGAGRSPQVRLLALFAVFVFGLGVVAGRLVLVQGLDSKRFAALGEDQRERKIVLGPQRGSIYDRDGAVLAMSMDMQTVFANPRFVPDAKAAAAALAPVLASDEASLEAKLSRKSGFVYLARKVDPEAARSAGALGIPGVDTVAEPKRFYPAGRLASHIVGFVGLDNEGLAGVEARYDRMLAGHPGEMLLERDPEGRPIPVGKSYLRPPTAGDDLYLTIDREIQYAAEVALTKAVELWGAKGGSAIVMRPRTGEILALANLPTFDPNDVRSSKPEDRKNRAVVDVYEPGSANKVITAAAAIESGVVRPTDVIRVPDSLKVGNKVFSDAHPHPALDLRFAEVIEQSSNIGTIKVALALGRDRLYEYLAKFGYGTRTGLEFPGEAAGILPKPDAWWKTSIGTIPIGQGVAVTPMQILSVYATIANDGVAVQPKLVAARVDTRGRRQATPPSAARRVIRSDTAKQVTAILLRVTEGEHGTGKAAAVPGYRVAGKTGTAQKPAADGRGYSGYIGSFIGFAPAGSPELAVAVILDEPTPIWGGVTAAPAFREIMQFSLRHLGIGPGPVLPPEGTPLPAPDRSGGAAPDPQRDRPVADGVAD